MIKINERNIWYIALFIWNCFMIFNPYERIVEGERELTLLGLITLITVIINVILCGAAIVGCFNGNIRFEFNIPIPFYKKYAEYKLNRELKKKRLIVLDQAVETLKEGDAEKFEILLEEYNKLEIIN